MRNIVYLICITAIFSIASQAQINTKSKDAGQKDSVKETKNNRWKPTLDLLIQEAGTITPIEKRPNAVAEVADAYWSLDKQLARNYFIEATAVALSLEKTEDRAKAFRYVLNLATRRDSSLAQSMIAEAERSRRLKDDVDNASIETADKILVEDVLRAAELLESIAPSGLKHGNAMYLIFQIARKEPELANRVFQSYLDKVLADENFPLELAVYTIGYAFGHADYYGIQANGEIVGASLVLPQLIAVNRNRTNAFLTYLYRRINRDLQNQALTPENQFKRMTALFVIDYLIDDVAFYGSNTLQNWEQLRREAATGLNPSQIELILNNVRQIKERRAHLKRRAENPENAPAEKEISEEEIEKIPDLCQRDRLYIKNALNSLSIKKYEQAKKWIDKVQDSKLRNSIETYYHFNLAENLANNKEWTEVPKHAKEISDDRLKVLLFAQLARKAVEQKQTETVSDWLQNSYKLAAKLENPAEKESLLFDLASLHPNDAEARDFFYEAVKLHNRAQASAQISKSFSFLIKVPLSCNDESEWFGGNASLKNGNLLASLSVLAEKNAENLLPIVYSLENAPVRIKAVSLLVKKALEFDKKIGNS
jgi:hypothetical protein